MDGAALPRLGRRRHCGAHCVRRQLRCSSRLSVVHTFHCDCDATVMWLATATATERGGCMQLRRPCDDLVTTVQRAATASVM